MNHLKDPQKGKEIRNFFTSYCYLVNKKMFPRFENLVKENYFYSVLNHSTKSLLGSGT